MPSPQKKEHGSGTAATSVNLSNFTSFHAAMDTFQSLRDHVQDITLDKITEADNKAKQILQRLSTLQATLGNLNGMKKRLTQAKEAADGLALETSASVEKHSLKKLSHDLEDRLPSNLILFPVPAKALKEEPDPTTDEPTLTPSRTSLLEQPEAIETIDQSLPADENLPPDDLPTMNLDETTAPEASLPENALARAESSPEAEFPERDEDIEQPPPFTFPTEIDQPDETIPAGDGTDKTVKEDADFDQGLLNQIIKDYGELFTDPNCSVDNENTTSITTESEVQSFTESAESSSTDESGYNHQKIHKKGDLDFDTRLKTLIQDYGKVDIYSHYDRNYITSLMKKAAVVALVLGVGYFVLGYFFSGSEITESTSRIGVNEIVPRSPEGTTTPLITKTLPPTKTRKAMKPTPRRVREASDSRASSDLLAKEPNVADQN